MVVALSIPFMYRKWFPRMPLLSSPSDATHIRSQGLQPLSISLFSQTLAEHSPGHPVQHGIHRDLLRGPSLSLIRDLSCRLQVLTLKGSIDLLAFFKHFVDVAENQNLTSSPSWPALRVLVLHGLITRRNVAKPVQAKDKFLKSVGLAVRRMPKAEHVLIESKLQPGSGSGSGQMMFSFDDTSLLDEERRKTKFSLLVLNHTPSTSAENVWKETTLHTKREQLGIESPPNGEVFEIGESWKAWKEANDKLF